MDGCPNVSSYWLDPRTGERRPRPCRLLACGYCGPRLALSTANAIVLARPESSAVLTVWGPDTPTNPERLFRMFAKAIPSIASKLRADGRALEYVWVLELSQTRIANAHVLLRGARPSRHILRAVAIDAGMRWGDVQPIRHLSTLARYILKLPLAPLDLGLDARACMELHLRLNGRRLVHASRRFWRDADGKTLTGVRAARTVARQTHRGRSRDGVDADFRARRAWDVPSTFLSRDGG